MDQKNNYQPLVSIIMNCYNGEKFLKECIKSVLAQTYKNWEIIFWDNKSKDKSAEIFKSYNDKRFKYYSADEYTSLYKARNLAIAKTNGELLAFIDVDDIWVKTKLETQVPLFNNPQISLAYSNLWIMKNTIENKKIFIKKRQKSGFINEELIDEYNVGIITVILRKKIISNLSKIFDERFSIMGDFNFFLNLSKSHYFHYTETPLAYYRIHDKNFSSIYKEQELKEFNIWVQENTANIESKKIEKIKKKISFRKFLHFRFNRKYYECFKILLQNYKSILVIKMLIVFLVPLYILKKISWFHS